MDISKEHWFIFKHTGKIVLAHRHQQYQCLQLSPNYLLSRLPCFCFCIVVLNAIWKTNLSQGETAVPFIQVWHNRFYRWRWDYMIGADIINPSGNWDNYYSKGERQERVFILDFMNICAPFSSNEYNWGPSNFQLRKQPTPPAIVARFRIETCHISSTMSLKNFSDRFRSPHPALQEQVTIFVNVWDAIRRYGLSAREDVDIRSCHY